MTTLSNTSFALPAKAVHAITEEVRHFGRQDVETGGFLLAPRGGTRVTMMAFAGEIGIIRNRLLFQVSALALDRLFGFAERWSCWIPAQFHSHAAGAFLSRTDQQLGLRMEGFTTTVVPDFANPPREVSAWGWWRFFNEDWIPCPPPQAGSGDLKIIYFDEDGIRA